MRFTLEAVASPLLALETSVRDDPDYKNLPSWFYDVASKLMAAVSRCHLLV